MGSNLFFNLDELDRYSIVMLFITFKQINKTIINLTQFRALNDLLMMGKYWIKWNYVFVFYHFFFFFYPIFSKTNGKIRIVYGNLCTYNIYSICEGHGQLGFVVNCKHWRNAYRYSIFFISSAIHL